MNIGLLKNGFRVAASWRSKKMHSVHLELQRRRCTSEQRLSNSLKNSRCHKNHLKSSVYSLLQDVDLQTTIYGSRKITLHHSSFLQFGNSWTCFRSNGWDEADQQHSMLVPFIKSLIFNSRGIYEVYCLWYKIQRYRGLATTNAEWAVTRKPCYRTPMAIQHFFFYCADSLSVSLAVHFSFILYILVIR